jgi:hypothetical protein
VGKADGSRECAPEGVPTIQREDVRFSKSTVEQGCEAAQ